jgi:microsomal dipeptidase-like Zn-dependent dipeptidase
MRYRSIYGTGLFIVIGCGGVQELPCNTVLPSRPGKTTGFECKVPSHRQATADLFDFNDKQWVRSDVFANAPITQANVLATEVRPAWTVRQRSSMPRLHSERISAEALVPLGGDYWQHARYPIVPQSTRAWVSSGYAVREGEVRFLGGEATGELTRSFKPRKYLRVSIGGHLAAIAGRDDASVGVELRVPVGTRVAGCQSATLVPPGKNEGGAVVAAAWRGSNQDAVETYQLDTDSPDCKLRGVEATLRIFDHSKESYVNVGRIEMGDDPLDVTSEWASTPVWGLADFHTHPTANLGFGGLQGIHTLWGVAGGGIEEYVGADKQRAIARDLPACDDPHMKFNAHGGGLAAPIMLNFAEHRTSQTLSDLNNWDISERHPSQGAPTFADFPSHRSGTHLQYHVTQLHRAYLGGLRLLSALALQDEGLEYGVGWVTCGSNGAPTVDTTIDIAVVRAHVEAMRELAAKNAEWMELVYSPEQARRAIRANKLAVVLGVEVPRIDQIDYEHQQDLGLVAEELAALGVRQVVVVHGMDNDLASSALFQDLYNSVNDWMHRDRHERDHVDELSGELTTDPLSAGKSVFFDITTTPSPLDASTPIQYRLSSPHRIVLSDMFPRPDPYTFKVKLLGQSLAFGALHPLVSNPPLFAYTQGQYDDQPRGHRNARGLTGRGREFIERLMQHGMMIDLAHMSDQTVVDTFDSANADHCDDYPLMISHAHFRPLAIKNDYSDRVGPFTDRTAKQVQSDLLGKGETMDLCAQRNERCNPHVLQEAKLAREQGPYSGEGTVDRGNLAREYDISLAEAHKVVARRGVIGVFLGQSPQDASALPSGFNSDCAGTSKGFAGSLLFAQDHLRHGLGLASDLGLISSVAPRFGRHACGGYLDIGSGSESGAQLLETLLEPGQYRFFDQRDPVVYSTDVASCVAGSAEHAKIRDAFGNEQAECGTEAPLEPYVLGERTFDFNYDGLANYGLLPDMLQDTANVLTHRATAQGVPTSPLDDLFSSADQYLTMWQSARRLAQCDSPDRPCDPLLASLVKDGRRACGNACPDSWNRGAPLQSIGEFVGTCDVGEPIYIDPVAPRKCVRDKTWRFNCANVPKNERSSTKPIWQQRRADPYEQGDLTEQGDWALFHVGQQPTWQCGNAPRQPLYCPTRTNYVQVRRILDTTISKPWEPRCDRLPLPPELGNRAVRFECLAGPHADQVSQEAAP